MKLNIFLFSHLSSVYSLLISFAHFVTGLFLLLSFESSLYFLDTNPLLDK